MRLGTPRIVVAGLAGDSGKTLVSIGLIRALVQDGIVVAPFKKGPDYIDAGWLGAAAARTARNLDSFLTGITGIEEAVARSLPAEVLVIEGNRGLFDGSDVEGGSSTAQIAKFLGAPVLLVLDVTKMTRTAAALVRGCQSVDPALNIGGAVLNRVATTRQERVIRDAIAGTAGIPVLGAIPRLDAHDPLPGRHLGLVTAQEHPNSERTLERAARIVRDHVDLEAVAALARSAAPVELRPAPPLPPGAPVTIGVFRDRVFSFFYPENLEALEGGGARLVFLSPLDNRPLPGGLDALYIGGGFPETVAAKIAAARVRMQGVRKAAAAQLPVYAECGGLMLLARELIVGGASYPMAGALDLVVEQTARPQGHGYTSGVVDAPNPFFPPGTMIHGHEFHYSRLIGGADRHRTVLSLDRGAGAGSHRDAIVRDQVWASYTHIHALGATPWADGLLTAARTFCALRQRAATAPA